MTAAGRTLQGLKIFRAELRSAGLLLAHTLLRVFSGPYAALELPGLVLGWGRGLLGRWPPAAALVRGDTCWGLGIWTVVGNR